MTNAGLGYAARRTLRCGTCGTKRSGRRFIDEASMGAEKIPPIFGQPNHHFSPLAVRALIYAATTPPNQRNIFSRKAQ